MSLLQEMATISSIATPLLAIPLVQLVKTITDIKIDIAKLKQATGVD